jgi:hypothetical protein
MVGLVFIETLRLTPVQWTALAFHAAGWLWYYWCSRHGTTPGSAGIVPAHLVQTRTCAVHPGSADSLSVSCAGGTPALIGTGIVPASCCSRPWMLTAILTLSGLWIAFWNTTTCGDVWWLFDQAGEMLPLAWPDVLERLPKQLYIDKQPPFFTFWVSRTPVLWMHQLLFFPWAILCAGLMWQLYGRKAALLLATPVFALMIHQPSNDVLLFGTLLIVLRLRQLSSGVSKQSFDNAVQRRHWPGVAGLLKLRFSTPEIVLAAFLYGLTWMIKPLTMLTAPFILPHLGIAGLLSLVMWGGYVGWSLQWEFGWYQLRFLLQQVMIMSIKTSKTGKIPRVPLTLSATLRKLLRKLQGSLRWRWKHLGHKAVKALPFYLFPAWLRPWTWRGIALAVVIVIGYGQIKYLLLDLLFLFPVREESEIPSVGLMIDD